VADPELPLVAEAGLLVTATPTAMATAPAPAAARMPVVSETLLSMPLRRSETAYFLVLSTFPTCPVQLRSLTAMTLYFL
jgi:hypothetical protein